MNIFAIETLVNGAWQLTANRFATADDAQAVMAYVISRNAEDGVTTALRVVEIALGDWQATRDELDYWKNQ